MLKLPIHTHAYEYNMLHPQLLWVTLCSAARILLSLASLITDRTSRIIGSSCLFAYCFACRPIIVPGSASLTHICLFCCNPAHMYWYWFIWLIIINNLAVLFTFAIFSAISRCISFDFCFVFTFRYSLESLNDALATAKLYKIIGTLVLSWMDEGGDEA